MMITTEELEKPIKAALYNVGLLLVTLSIAFLISSLLVGRDFGEMFWFFFHTSVGSVDSILRMLMRTTPILVATLGLIMAFRSGVWNIGGEGQIVIGVIVTTGICLFLPLPPVVAVLLSFITSFLASGVYAAMAGLLKARWDVNEIAVTMMQNFVAIALLQYLIDDPWNWGEGLYPRTAKIPADTRLPFLLQPLNSTFLIGVALAVGTYILLKRTVFGYELQAMRSNRVAALSHGIDTARLTVLSMLLSGGLCGLAGTGLVLGEYFRAQAGISGNYGFYAVAAALIADNKASRAPFAALLIAFLSQGTLGLIALGVPQRLGEVIIGAVFITILVPRVMKERRGN
jgi:ABC-type uncharacterized transport system permease subunit